MKPEDSTNFESIEGYSVMETLQRTPPQAPGENNKSSAPRPAQGERFEYASSLGEGGMGKVDLYWDRDLMRKIAVKRLRPELLKESDFLRQFLWEARLCAALDHPSIAPVFDLGLTSSEQLYFSMKYVEGWGMEEIIHRLAQGDEEMKEEFPLSRRLRIFMQLGYGLATAHRQGVLHRDLKPANIMVGSEGEVYIMDWGLAAPTPDCKKHIEEVFEDYQPRDGLVGTPLYMSPEQAAGQASHLDKRSDIYSLGVILYELVSLRSPYEGEKAAQILEAVKEARLRPLEDFCPEATSHLIAVINMATARDPDDRYQTVSAFQEDLERVLDNKIPGAYKAHWTERALTCYLSQHSSFGRMTKMDIDLMSTGGALCGGAIGYWLYTYLQAWVAPVAFVGGILLSIPFLYKFFGFDQKD